jgi:hypothetical protein
MGAEKESRRRRFLAAAGCRRKREAPGADSRYFRISALRLPRSDFCTVPERLAK